jgi:hypothetical protein
VIGSEKVIEQIENYDEYWFDCLQIDVRIELLDETKLLA